MIDFLQKKGGAIYFSICMLVFLFVVYSGNGWNHFIDIPHVEIPILPLYIVLAVMFVFVLFLIPLKNSKLDQISLLLCVPILIHTVNSIYMGMHQAFFVCLATSILSLCSYLIARNMNEEIKYLEKAFSLFFLILLVQIIAEGLLSGASDSMYQYKHEMCIPIGSSNALTTKLLPYFAFLYSISNRRRGLLCIATFVAVVMTSSRGGLMDFILILSILFVLNRKKRLSFLGKSLIALFCLFFASYEFWNSELGSQMFVKNDGSIVGRYELWKTGIEIFKEHPFLGNGFYYGSLANNPHNFIIDLMMRSGIAGMSVFLLLIYTLYSSIRCNFVNKYIQGGGVALLALFFQGLVEIVFFSYVHEMILWTFVGYLIRKNELICAENVYASHCSVSNTAQERKNFFIANRSHGPLSCIQTIRNSD